VTSSLAWLDSSREDQQRMRELIGMFSDKETLDELGIGRIRDALSDLLFPGTSTLQTRARYLVIVPWCYQAAERKRLSGTKLTTQVAENERVVIGTLKKAGATDGLIGRVAGVAVKTLPSTIYWTALARYGIRRGDEGRSWLATEAAVNAEANELAERSPGMWHPTVPPVPAGFPWELPGGLHLSESEARWLRDRMLAGATGSLLAHLLGHGRRPMPGSTGPWDDPAAVEVDGRPAEILNHADLFSLAIEGATLLYQLLVAERYESAGLTKIEDPVDQQRQRLVRWADDVEQRAWHLRTWARADMWQAVAEENPNIDANPVLRRFVDTWIDAVVGGAARSVADDTRLRELAAWRERALKRAQSRLVNDQMLRAWTGGQARPRLTFRWPNVRRLVTDINDGLDHEVADASA
jgi:hypothetical protein